ncbi:MAG: hypothetical protein KGL44_03650 [Sphingomonadales bacterium]|nr:hypothetical protein [Sphingomonadales bacterium]
MPLKWKSKTLLAKIETVSGTDAVPTAAANGVLATNVTLSPMEGEDVSRNLDLPYMGASPSIPVGLRSMLSFDVELVGSGALGTAPAFGPLLRMCAVAEVITAGVKVEYNPITDAHESGSIYFAIDTIRHVLTGARGTAVFKLNAQGIPVISFAITGLFNLPSDQAKVTPVFTAWQDPTVATKANTPTFTIANTAFVLRDFSLDLGCQVEPRMLIGSESILIVDKAEQFKATVEAVPLATYNPYQVAQAQTKQAVQLVHGTVASKRWTLDQPRAQQRRLASLENAQNILEWPLQFDPLPNAGNDQWKLTFA